MRTKWTVILAFETNPAGLPRKLASLYSSSLHHGPRYSSLSVSSCLKGLFQPRNLLRPHIKADRLTERSCSQRPKRMGRSLIGRLYRLPSNPQQVVPPQTLERQCLQTGKSGQRVLYASIGPEVWYRYDREQEEKLSDMEIDIADDRQAEVNWK
jgi:hypothetical protein